MIQRIRSALVARNEQRRMEQMGLPLPGKILELVAGGHWPRKVQRVDVSLERLQAVIPWERELWLCPPPFRTLRELDRVERKQRGHSYWTDPMAAPGELDHDLAVLIGEYEIGADAALVLDFRCNRRDPAVLTLHWKYRATSADPYDNHWVGIARNFDDFAARIGLTGALRLS